MTSLVFSVTAAATISGVVLYVSASISTNFGVSSSCKITFSRAENVNEGRITSDPASSRNARTTICRAEVPEFTATAYLLPV